MARYDDINTRSVFLAGLVSTLVVIVVVLGLRVLYFAMQQRQQAEKVMQTEYVGSEAHLAGQAAALGQYGVDPNSGRLQIPISRAIEIVTEQSGNQSSAEDKSVSAPAPDEA